MKDNSKKIKIILAILIIISPYIYSNGNIRGDLFLSPMYEVFYFSKILCTIVGVNIIIKEI